MPTRFSISIFNLPCFYTSFFLSASAGLLTNFISLMAAASVLTNSFTSFLHKPKSTIFSPSSSSSSPILSNLRRNGSSTTSILFKSNNPSSKFLSNSLRFSHKIYAGTSLEDEGGNNNVDVAVEEVVLVGEDSGVFELEKQKISSWIYFSLVLGVVLFILDVVWIDNSTGFGKAFVESVSSISNSHEVVMLALILVFAVVHSGLASLRDAGEKLIGERAFRVLFAGISLPLAVSTVVYFINHRYDGTQLWELQTVPGVHEMVWISNFISFMFLYPSTFNLLEVAAVDKPKMHLWETGIMRITRHPQMAGQVLWCLAHSIWIGNSVTVAASVGLIGHHLFGVWNGDRRLAIRYGDAFDAVKSRTSVVPFAAILDGRQKLPKDYYKEFIRLPYVVITGLTVGAYFAHPLMQAASFRLHW